MNTPCGCYYSIDDDGIRFCPLHAQAVAMRDVLETLAAFHFSSIAEEKGYATALAALCTIKRQARAVLQTCEEPEP